MKTRLLLAVALAFLAGCKGGTADDWPKPALEAHAAAVPTGGDALAAELELGQRNFFAIQRYYLGFSGGERKRARPLTTEEAAWVAGVIAAESEALGRLLPAMEKTLAAPAPTEDLPLPTIPHVSLAIVSVHSDGPWDIAQGRANLAGSLAYFHRLRRSKRAAPDELARARESTSHYRTDLARVEKARSAGARQ